MGKKKADKPTEEAQPTQTTFEAKINKYGFLHFGKPLMEAWQLSKGVEQPVAVELTPEGSLIIRKT